jgi:KaiC/GvpD/RAD55 family RecA-like ATPase
MKQKQKKHSTPTDLIPPPRKVNECIAAIKNLSPPEPLFDEFWREGELALLFGASGIGKSILAVQIADALARGRAIEGFMMRRGRQKVLYVDLELSDKQFITRYSTFENGDASTYKFSDNFHRDRPPSLDKLAGWLRGIIVQRGIRVVIIDSLAALKTTADGTRETLELMRELRRITHEFDISILVVTDAAEPARTSLPSERDLGRSRILCSPADSVFAIGTDPKRADEKCVHQTRVRNSPIIWNASNAPRCRIRRNDTGLLAFEFDERFRNGADIEKRELIRRIKTMHDDGEMSFRAIADELGSSRSTCERLYKKWTPSMEPRPSRLFDDDDEVDAALANKDEVDNSVFPGCDEYDEALADPRFAGLDERTDDAARHLRRELYNLRLARDDAKYIYETTGTTPPLDSKSSDRVNKPTDASDTTDEQLDDTLDEPENPFTFLGVPLTLHLDRYGTEMWVETTDSLGRPIVWYQLSKQGRCRRYERRLFGVFVTEVKNETGERIAA